MASMPEYSLRLPAYSIGTDVLSNIPGICTPYGKSAVIIGGRRAMDAIADKIEKASGPIDIIGRLWYGGEATEENIQALAEKEVVPTSMTDVSEGLADSLLHLAKASGHGCEVYEERLPIDYQTSRVCSEMSKNMLPVSCALNGGKDYELLFTVAQKDYEKIKTMEGIHIIGYVTEKGMPSVMVTPQNTTIELVAQGFNRQ